jgi:hypothetical protein
MFGKHPAWAAVLTILASVIGGSTCAETSCFYKIEANLMRAKKKGSKAIVCAEMEFKYHNCTFGGEDEEKKEITNRKALSNYMVFPKKTNFYISMEESTVDGDTITTDEEILKEQVHNDITVRPDSKFANPKTGMKIKMLHDETTVIGSVVTVIVRVVWTREGGTKSFPRNLFKIDNKLTNGEVIVFGKPDCKGAWLVYSSIVYEHVLAVKNNLLLV